MAQKDKIVTLDDLKAAYDDVKSAVNGKADKEGYYQAMTVGDAEQLVATVSVQDKAPYLLRTSGGSADIGDLETDTVVGGTLVWNQLVGASTESVTLTSGHKYAACIDGVWSVGASDGTAISVTGGTDQLFDLTQMFGSAIADYISSLETSIPGAGVAWFRALFPRDNYAYDAGSLQSVQVSAHKTVGFNQFDASTVENSAFYSPSGIKYTWRENFCCSDFIPIIPGRKYYVKDVYYQSVYNAVLFGADKQPINYGIQVNEGMQGTVYTMPDNAHYLIMNSEISRKGDVVLNLSYDGGRDGEYEPYTAHTYALDAALTLRGVPKLDASNRLYYDGDTYESDGTVTRRYEVRAYQAGDEALEDAVTDGTNTVVKLSTPTTETAAPFTNPQVVDDFGTEQYIDAGNRDVEIPVGHDTFYRQNLRAKLEMAPDSPESSGDYLMRRNNGKNSYVPFISPLPALPTTDGAYTLKCTVSGGTAALTWEAET